MENAACFAYAQLYSPLYVLLYKECAVFCTGARKHVNTIGGSRRPLSPRARGSAPPRLNSPAYFLAALPFAADPPAP